LISQAQGSICDPDHERKIAFGMLTNHAIFRQELDQVRRFQDFVGGKNFDGEKASQHVAHAFEDLPQDTHELLHMILMSPTEDVPLRQKVVDVIKNAGGAVGGEFERIKWLHLLSHLRSIPYTYRLDAAVTRGSRPDAAKLERLAQRGYKGTINLCQEMREGDTPLNENARLNTYHIEILDGTPPELRQVQEVLGILSEEGNQPNYIHCEAGVGRTGVMVACYRMAITGWPLSDAYEEAINFGCAMPDQRRFIEDFKRSLDLGDLPGYPKAAGVRATSEQLRQTVALHQDPAGLAAALAAA
jgi:hypothetical protein